MFRVDEVGANSSAESSQVLVHGVALSVLKSLSESTEPCCPSDQACSPVLSLSSLTVAYQNGSHTLEVPHRHTHQLHVPLSPIYNVYVVIFILNRILPVVDVVLL